MDETIIFNEKETPVTESIIFGVDSDKIIPPSNTNIKLDNLSQINSRFQKVHISEPLTLSFSEAINYCDKMGLQLPVPDSLIDNKKLLDLGLFSFVHHSGRTFIRTNEFLKTF